MEEYKRIIRSVSVPSFHTLLLVSSVILISFSLFLKSLPGTIAGFCLLAAALAVFINYALKKIKTPVLSEKYQGTGARGKIIHVLKEAAIPAIISAVALIRILSLMQFNPVNSSSVSFSAEVVSVNLLQYGIEAELVFSGDDKGSSSGRAISYFPKKPMLYQGDRIEIRKKPVELKTDAGDALYTKRLIRKGIRYIFNLNNKDDYKLIENADLNMKEKIRRALEQNIDKLFDPATAPLVKALYIGNKNYLDKATILDYKRAGALHILAASGLHLGVIASMVFYSLLLFRINRRLLTLITLAAVSFYLYITDVPVSLLRAYVMFAVFSVQYLFDFEKNIANTLFISAIAILAVFPYDLYDLGFQLSFGATLGIILFFRIYRRVFSFLPSFFSNTLAVTVSAQIMVLPIILFQLNEINMTGILSNLVLIPATSFTLVSSVISNMAAPFSDTAAGFAAYITDKSNAINTCLVEFFSGINGHFYFEGYYYALLPAYLCLLSPLIPSPKIKKFSIYLFISGVISGWALLSDFSIPAGRQVAILNKDNTRALLIKDGENAAIIGTIEDKSHADILTRFIMNRNIRSVDLYIPKPDFNSLKHFSYFIKKNVVKRCVVSPDAISNFYFKKFCGIADNDRIKMEVKDFNLSNEREKDNYQYDIYYLYVLMIRGELKQADTGCPVIKL